MLILGIESSCDETAAAIVEDGRCVKSNVVASQTDLHAEYAGVVPEIASRAHVESILPVVRRALSDAGITLADIDAVAVGNRPGLIGSLLVGVAAAKAIAWSLHKPLIGVDHVHAHLYSGALHKPGESALNIEFPALGLVISGGHTSLYLLKSWTDLTRLGATIDDAIGEAFDKAATMLGIPFPGGPNLDTLAQTPGADPTIADLPISRLSPSSLDFSFSGLKTAMLYEVKGVPTGPRAKVASPPAPQMTESRRASLAAAFQKAAVSAVTLRIARSIEQLAQQKVQLKTLLVGGGVSANSRMRSELAAAASRHGLTLRIPAMQYCMDNAAMLAGLGHELFLAGRVSDLTLQAVPTTGV